ncbi:MAG: hypothetical protein IT426_16225 [Pirellulales bacterium]|nr:hypothetical protein [Pirellulales bacterium]
MDFDLQFFAIEDLGGRSDFHPPVNSSLKKPAAVSQQSAAAAKSTGMDFSRA